LKIRALTAVAVAIVAMVGLRCCNSTGSDDPAALMEAMDRDSTPAYRIDVANAINDDEVVLQGTWAYANPRSGVVVVFRIVDEEFDLQVFKQQAGKVQPFKSFSGRMTQYGRVIDLRKVDGVNEIFKGGVFVFERLTGDTIRVMSDGQPSITFKRK